MACEHRAAEHAAPRSRSVLCWPSLGTTAVRCGDTKANDAEWRHAVGGASGRAPTPACCRAASLIQATQEIDFPAMRWGLLTDSRPAGVQFQLLAPALWRRETAPVILITRRRYGYARPRNRRDGREPVARPAQSGVRQRVAGLLPVLARREGHQGADEGRGGSRAESPCRRGTESRRAAGWEDRTARRDAGAESEGLVHAEPLQVRGARRRLCRRDPRAEHRLSLIHISEPTRLGMISY